MDYILHGNSALELTSNTVIHNSQDFLDFIGSNPSEIYIFRKTHFSKDFFNLSTGVAGEILQKVSNYNKRIAIIGDFKDIKKKSLKDFIYESNKTRQVVFVETIEQAKQLLGIRE